MRLVALHTESYSVLLRTQTLWVEKINLVHLESGRGEMRTVRGFDYCDGL